jgi:hypothetical protein
MLNAILGMKKWRVAEPLEYLKLMEYKLLRSGQMQTTPQQSSGEDAASIEKGQ